MRRVHHPAVHSIRAIARRWSTVLSLCVSFTCTTVLLACTEPAGPAPGAGPDIATRAAPVPVSATSATSEPGIGGAFFMAASGDAVTPVDLQATGIVIPSGTQVEVEVTGSITRTRTPGLEQFCALAHMRPRCLDAWAEILRESPLTPSGGSAPRAMVAWEGGAPAFPDSATGLALAGPAGGELWAGRNGLQCWYVDHVTGIQGACFTFGGGYLVTVRSRPEVAIGGGGSDAVRATLTIAVLESTVGTTGGSADLALRVATTPDTVPEPMLGFTHWYFIPDSLRTETGTPVPSPFEMRASYGAGAAQALPERLDAERVRLPDGRIVGSGIHFTQSRAPGGVATARAARSGAARSSAARSSAARSSAPRSGGGVAQSSSTAATGTVTDYPECEAASECHVEFTSPAGTIVASTRLGGVPVSASVRIGVTPGVTPGTLAIVRVAGPNPAGSFTTRENQVALEAAATPGYSGSVGWEFVDDPDDEVTSPRVQAGEGVATVATIGQSFEGRGRWPAYHPGRIDQKAFRYIVRAHATYGGTRVYSEPVVLEQHPVDVIRQEFIDYDTPPELTPLPNAFMQVVPQFVGVYQFSPASETGLGDYCVTGGASCTTLVNERLAPFLAWLGTTWKHQPLVATSIFRNPVHHHGHSPAARNNSPHKYGTAVDYDVAGADKSVQQRLHWTALRNTGLRFPQGGVCAETWYLGTTWAGNHVHFDRRLALQSPCLDTWRVPESIVGQRSTAALPGSGHDTLVAMVRSDDFETRFAAAAALAELPVSELPAGYAEAAHEQLKAEIALRLGGAVVGSTEYGAYLLELARVVHRSGDPAAARSLARLGIEVSLGIRRFVARYAALSIPALEDAWRTDASLHADIVGTYGEMRRFEADSGWTLDPDDAATVDRAFLRAAAGGVVGQWGVAFHVGHLRLVEYAPLLALIASEPASAEDPFGLVAAAAGEGMGMLQATLAAVTPDDLLRALTRLQASVCTRATGQRLGQCTALEAELSNARRALDGGIRPAAAAALGTYRDLLHRAAERGIFTALERRLLDDNAFTLMGKLD